MPRYDAIVIGAGPNGLAAAVVLARAGRRVLVREAADTIGGGCRSAELTLPGFTHDICSAVHPFAVASPVFRTLPLAAHGLEWIEPPVMLAHPLDTGGAFVYRSLERTAASLGADGGRYLELMRPLARAWTSIEPVVLGAQRLPRRPLALARFGLLALRSAAALSRRFAGEPARALVAGMAAHSLLPLDRRPTAGVALALTISAHTTGWLFPRGGAQSLANALGSYLRSLGGEIETGAPVTSLDDLPPARAVLCDLAPAPLLRIAGDRLPAGYRRSLARYRYGPGSFKVDYALDAPIPWRHPECARAGTVHLGGTFEEIAAAEEAAWRGRAAERPYVLLAQPTLFDPGRAPAGRHVAWVYCHVPSGSTVDMLARIEAQIERFAPGFRDRVLARAVMGPADLERYNPNYVGGDIGAGVMDLGQLVTRPTWRAHATPVHGLLLCSASTPPGVGVHGMCGYLAARRALAGPLRG